MTGSLLLALNTLLGSRVLFHLPSPKRAHTTQVLHQSERMAAAVASIAWCKRALLLLQQKKTINSERALAWRDDYDVDDYASMGPLRVPAQTGQHRAAYFRFFSILIKYIYPH